MHVDIMNVCHLCQSSSVINMMMIIIIFVGVIFSSHFLCLFLNHPLEAFHLISIDIPISLLDIPFLDHYQALYGAKKCFYL